MSTTATFVPFPAAARPPIPMTLAEYRQHMAKARQKLDDCRDYLMATWGFQSVRAERASSAPADRLLSDLLTLADGLSPLIALCDTRLSAGFVADDETSGPLAAGHSPAPEVGVDLHPSQVGHGVAPSVAA